MAIPMGCMCPGMCVKGDVCPEECVFGGVCDQGCVCPEGVSGVCVSSRVFLGFFVQVGVPEGVCVQGVYTSQVQRQITLETGRPPSS